MTTADRPCDAEFGRSKLDLDPRYGWFRRNEPVAKVRLPDGAEAWLVTRWEDARRVLADPVFSRALAVGRQTGVPRRETLITDMDPPEHTRVRRSAVRSFTHRRIQRLRPRAQQIVDGLLDAMAGHGGPADLVERLALPLPVTIICELLGVPAGDRQLFQSWSDAFLSVTAYTPEEVQAAHAGLDGYLKRLIAERRSEPAGDLLSELVHARDEAGTLSESELTNLGIGLLIAGYETTASQITNLAYVLLTQRVEWERLVDRPELLPGAIEELLRFVPLGSDTGMPRVAAKDVRLGGVLVREGETVLVARPSANRDESVFPEGETLRLDRVDNPHLAFGYGIHHCLGAHLARMELQVAIGSLLSRFPQLRLAVPEPQLRWKEGLLIRGLRELPVQWQG